MESKFKLLSIIMQMLGHLWKLIDFFFLFHLFFQADMDKKYLVFSEREHDSISILIFNLNATRLQTSLTFVLCYANEKNMPRSLSFENF